MVTSTEIFWSFQTEAKSNYSSFAQRRPGESNTIPLGTHCLANKLHTTVNLVSRAVVARMHGQRRSHRTITPRFQIHPLARPVLSRPKSLVVSDPRFAWHCHTSSSYKACSASQRTGPRVQVLGPSGSTTSGGSYRLVSWPVWPGVFDMLVLA